MGLVGVQMGESPCSEALANASAVGTPWRQHSPPTKQGACHQDVVKALSRTLSGGEAWRTMWLQQTLRCFCINRGDSEQAREGFVEMNANTSLIAALMFGTSLVGLFNPPKQHSLHNKPG